MINSSRLPQASQPNSNRSAQDETRGADRRFGKLGEEPVPSEGLLAGGMIGPNSNLGKTSSFNELLQMSKLDPGKEVAASKKANKAVALEGKNDRHGDINERKTRSESNSSRKSSKDAKSKGNQDSKQAQEEYLALAQLLTPQPLAGAEQLKIQNPMHTANTEDSKSILAKSQQVNNVQNEPNNINEITKDLDQKIDNLTQMNSNLKTQESSVASNELTELASKFDEVKFDFNNSQGQSTQLNKVGNGQAQQELQNLEMMKKLAEQEWAQNDLALRDLVSQHALQESAMEQISLDRLEAMSRLKEAQSDRLNMLNLESTNFEKQLQLQEINSSKQPQWQSYKELSPDDLAMLDSLSGTKPDIASMATPRAEGNGMSSSISSRLMGGESNAPIGKAITQDAVSNLQSPAGMTFEGRQGNSSGNNSNSSMSGNTARGEPTALGGVNAQRADAAKGNDPLAGVDEKKEARARESERTREMARAAALRAQNLAAELAVKGGGTAKVQIKDSQLGVVELRINMSDDNRIKVELVANSERIKQELEKQSDELKSGLEKNKLVLEGVSFATDVKLGDSAFQSSTQSDSRNQQSQQQPQQGFNSFAQNQSSPGQQGFNQERFLQQPNFPLNTSTAVTGSAKKNYSGKNESQTNIQRNANGSLKVTA